MLPELDLAPGNANYQMGEGKDYNLLFKMAFSELLILKLCMFFSIVQSLQTAAALVNVHSLHYCFKEHFLGH